MPSPYAFLRGFKLRKGVQIGGWKIEKIFIQHTVIERYNKYEFPIKIYLKAVHGSSQINAKTALKQYTFHFKIINSQYGNPYKCTIKNWNFYSTTKNINGKSRVVLKATGVAIRKR